MRSTLEVSVHPRVPISYAEFSGERPTSKQLQELKERELGISFRQLPDGYLDLTRLVEDVPFVQHLSIIDGSCSDANPLGDLPNLRSLELSINQKTDVDLERFVELERFWGDHDHFESVVNCPNLKSLALQGTKGNRISEIRGPLEYLELIDAKKLKSLPLLLHASSLKQLWVLGSTQLSLELVSEYLSLEELSLESCGSVTEVDELQRLESLNTLGLIACRSIEPKEALLALNDVDIAVMNRNPFDAAFRAQAEVSGSRWAYYGSARTAPPIAKL